MVKEECMEALWPFLRPQVIASWTLVSLLWLLRSPVSFMIYAHFDCDFQDVHNSFPANSSQTIQISFPSSVPWLFELEKQWVKKYVEPSMVCSSLKLRHLAHFFLVGRLWECLNTYEIVYQRLLGSFWMQVFLISDIFFSIHNIETHLYFHTLLYN